VAAEGTPIDRDKLLTVGVLPGGRSRSKVREGRDETGRFKAITDELGNTVTERAGDRQDVTIRAPHVVASTTVREERG
jgi:hypothetical protein